MADAVDVARRALLELEPSAVGSHLGVSLEDESAATHRFEATLPGYRGWQWAVVVAAPPGAEHVTVSESALLPGPDALVAPDFIPWEQRVRPGDLAPGDLLAPPANDPRLVPGYIATGDPVVDEVALEIGLGRTQVLSLEGRAEAADRWYAEFGPDTDMAKAAPSTCGLCGFYLPLAGAMRAAFGVCANAMGADGRVVHTEYGCGAHSDVEGPTGGGSPLYEAYDDAAYDVVPTEKRKPSTEADDSAAAAEPGVEAIAPAAAEAETVPGEDVAAGAAPSVDGEAGSAAASTEPSDEVLAATQSEDVEAVAPVESAAAATEPRDEVLAAAQTAQAEPGVEAVASNEPVAASANGVPQENSAADEAQSTAVSVRPKGEVAVREGGPGPEPVDAHVVAHPEAEESATYVADSDGSVVADEQIEMLGAAAVEDSESESSRS